MQKVLMTCQRTLSNVEVACSCHWGEVGVIVVGEILKWWN
jgi:hypothetical protein